MPQSFEKDPDAMLDYAVEWGAWLAGDTISASSWDVETGDVVIASDTIIADKAVVWLSGGTPGTTATVRNRITSLAGRVDDRTLTFLIRER